MANNVTRLNAHNKKERFSCKASVVAADIVIYVPGTTDPFNIKDTILESNKTYWKENIHFQGLFYDFKAKFCEMHINTDFTWTGDNNVKERKKAGENLFGFLLRYYKGYLNRKVSLHFIGHSHGGLIINECLQHFKKNKTFPKNNWKVKSITYLSTPFFKKEHLPDTTYFHKDCKIFAVNNKYDLTQRFIADFSMQQLPLLLKKFTEDTRIKAIFGRISSAGSTIDAEAKKQFNENHTSTEAMRTIYNALIPIIPEIRNLFSTIIQIFLDLKNEGRTLNHEIIDQFTTFFGNLDATLANTVRDLRSRLVTDTFISRDDMFVDLNMRASLRLISDLFQINTSTYESRLLQFIDEMLVNQIEDYNNTVVEPPYPSYKPYYDGKPINVESSDPYHKKPNKEKEFDKFIKEIERLEKIYESKQTSRVRAEIILRLLAPMNLHAVLTYVSGKLDTLDYVVSHDDTEVQIKRLIVILNNYSTVLQSFYVDTIHAKDTVATPAKEMPALYMSPSQRGSIVYLAFISHSISRMYLDPELSKQIEPLFDSTKNPGYSNDPKKLEKTLYKIIDVIKKQAK